MGCQVSVPFSLDQVFGLPATGSPLPTATLTWVSFATDHSDQVGVGRRCTATEEVAEHLAYGANFLHDVSTRCCPDARPDASLTPAGGVNQLILRRGSTHGGDAVTTTVGGIAVASCCRNSLPRLHLDCPATTSICRIPTHGGGMVVQNFEKLVGLGWSQDATCMA